MLKSQVTKTENFKNFQIVMLKSQVTKTENFKIDQMVMLKSPVDQNTKLLILDSLTTA